MAVSASICSADIVIGACITCQRTISEHGGVDALAERVLDGETDPYSIADEVLDPVAACLERDEN